MLWREMSVTLACLVQANDFGSLIKKTMYFDRVHRAVVVRGLSIAEKVMLHHCQNSGHATNAQVVNAFIRNMSDLT